MKIGYIIGCIISILLWKFDRQEYFNAFNNIISRVSKNKYFLQLIYILIILIIYIFLRGIVANVIYDTLTTFFIIDISNTENKNLEKRGKLHFYDSISTVSRAIICGFLAPLFYVLLFGNIAGIIYSLVFYFSAYDTTYNFFESLLTLLNILPAVIAEIFLYFIYIFRNKNLFINFKGDYLINLFERPLLNADIMAAYIESVNFYFYFNRNKTDYIKSYGDYKNEIDKACVRDYLSIAYGICMIIFIIFYILVIKKY